MNQVKHIRSCTASLHIARAAAFVSRAERYLSVGISTAGDRYRHQQSQTLALDLRCLDAPLNHLSRAVRKGGVR